MGFVKGEETKRQKAAFEYYYELGKDRTYGKVCDKFGVSRAAVKVWSDKYMWKERVEERDAEIARGMKEKDEDSFIAEMEGNRKIIRAAMAEFIKKLKEGKVEVEKVRDAVNLLKLDMEYVTFINQLKVQKQENKDVLLVSNDTRETLGVLLLELDKLDGVDNGVQQEAVTSN